MISTKELQRNLINFNIFSLTTAAYLNFYFMSLPIGYKSNKCLALFCLLLLVLIFSPCLLFLAPRLTRVAAEQKACEEKEAKIWEDDK
jgi:hypothetical protein